MSGVAETVRGLRAQPVCVRDLCALRELSQQAPLELKVSGTCMAPLLPAATSVLVAPALLYLPGDLIVFRSHGGRLFTHRLIGIYRRRGRWRYLAQPDRASAPDGAVLHEQIIGRVCGGEVCRELAAIPLRHRFWATLRFASHAWKRLASGYGLRRPLPRPS